MLNSSQRRLILIVALIGIILISIVLLSAYAAELKIGNNTLVANNAALQGEIDMLDVKITEANSIDQIEEIAINDLGMVYADADEYIVISGDDAPNGSLALTIRGNAYN
jgi:cell division protein FtsL